MDVVNLHKFGIQNVVANLGTAMTEKQIDLIWGFFKNPIICLDGDSSGQKAALRVAERLFPLMYLAKVVSERVLPPKAKIELFKLLTGKIILFLNLSTYFFGFLFAKLFR